MKRHLQVAIENGVVTHDTQNASLERWLLNVYIPNHYDLASGNMAIMKLKSRMQAIIHVEGRPLGQSSTKSSPFETSIKNQLFVLHSALK